jgi:hypothetical protein
MYYNPKTLDTDTLLQYCANARTTWLECGGHGKAFCNQKSYEAFKAELDSRGVTEEQMKAIKGRFNGDGSL